jgi:hypothetical protein
MHSGTPADTGEPPEKVYLSRVVNNSQTTCILMLCDSGASRSVVGKGPAASRILSSHAVAFDTQWKTLKMTCSLIQQHCANSLLHSPWVVLIAATTNVCIVPVVVVVVLVVVV